MRIFNHIFILWILCFTGSCYALTCTDDPVRNRIVANNYLLSSFYYIPYTPANKSVHQERWFYEKWDNYNVVEKREHIINYDPDGLLTQFTIASDDLTKTILIKKPYGWLKEIDNPDDVNSSQIIFLTDDDDRITSVINKYRKPKAQMDEYDIEDAFNKVNYQYDHNNCLSAFVQISHNKQYTNYLFQYQNGTFTHLMELRGSDQILVSEVTNDYDQQNRLIQQTEYSYFNDKDAILSATERHFNEFSEVGDWLKVEITMTYPNNPHLDDRILISREMRYY